MVRKESLAMFALVCFQLIPMYLEKPIKQNFYHCYGGPAHWGDWDDTCAGFQQSPIDLPCSVCKQVVKTPFPNFKRSETYFENPKYMEVIRNIDGVGIKPHFGKEVVTITGGPLADIYILDHIHFHWGHKDYVGSEHAINGKKFAMEAHVVYHDAKYHNIKAAEIKKNGVLVIAYLFQVVPEKNDPTMNCITCCFEKFYGKPTKTKVPHSFPLSLLFPAFQCHYLTYTGSLTTPPCYEGVTWIVYERVLDISRDNMEKFRKLYCVDPGLRNNYRPIQPLYGRKIYAKA